jgi:Tol biopolymer transport system component
MGNRAAGPLVDWLTSVVRSDVLEVLARRLQEVAMPAATAVRSSGHLWHARPWRLVALSSLAALLLALPGPAALAHPPGITQRVSMSSTGTAGDNDSVLAAISGNGRFVAFWSFASNLVPGDTNGTTDVFVHDRQAGTTERVSVDSRERQATGGDQGGVLDTNFGRPAISPDGRLVAFASSATNLVNGDRNQSVDVFLRDRVAGTTERVSLTGRRTQANGERSGPALSADGRFVAFTSFADNLVAGDTNFTSDVFVRDRQASTTERVSVSSTEEQANASSSGAAISPDGRLVAFTSDAFNLIPGDVDDAAFDVFLRDRQTGTTEGISTVVPSSELGRHSGSPSLSADGRLVAFHSWEPNLVPNDTNTRFDVFVLDRVSGTVERVSVNIAGVEGNNDSLSPSISADGRFVAFTSDADNLVADDGNFDLDIFVRDRQTQTTVRASVRTDGTETGFELGSLNAALSADGQVVAFESEGALVPEDSEFPVDVFVHDEQP